MLIIIGAILIFFIPLIITAYFKTAETNERIGEVQATLLAVRLSSVANSIGSLGPNSSMVSEVFVPPTVKMIELRNYETASELVVHVNSSLGNKELVELIKFKSEPNKIETNTGMIRVEFYWVDGEKISFKKN